MASSISLQGRFLAMVLPSLTLTIHTILFVLLSLNFLPSTPNSFFHVTSWFSLYNAFAIVASLAGVIGVIRSNRTLLSIYTLTHVTTLLIVTLTLLTIYFPTSGDSPFPPKYFDERKFCREMDGFGGDEEWIVRCSFRLFILKSVVECWVVLALAVQWWMLRVVWVEGGGSGSIAQEGGANVEKRRDRRGTDGLDRRQ